MRSIKRLLVARSPAGGVAASAAGSSNTLGVFPVSPQPGPTLAVPSSASTISSASDTFDKENICVCCVGMSTVNKSS